MLEQRKLRIVCFKATLTKDKNTVRLDIHRQLVRGAINCEICPENEQVRMAAVPELCGGTMFLLGRYREIPEEEKRFNKQHTTKYWLTHKDNLGCAARWIKQLMEEGHYGYGKQYRRNNR